MSELQTIELRRVDRADRPELERLVDDYLGELGHHREVPVGPTDAASYECIAEVASGDVAVREVLEDDGRRLEYRFEIAAP